MSDNDVRFTITAEDNASEELEDVGDNVERTGERTAKSWAKAEDASKKFTLALTAVGAAALTMGYVAVKAYNESEQVTTRLTKLILNQNGATMANVDALKNQAAAMQRVTTYGDDVVMMAQSQFATFDLSSESIQRLIPGFLDMAAAEKGAAISMQEMKDLSQGFGKALVGQADALVKQGFIFSDLQKEILKTGTEQEKITVLTEVMGRTYSGMAAAMRNTFQGQMIVAQNTLGDFMELIGEAITVYLKPMIVAFNQWTEAMGGPAAAMEFLTNAIAVLAPYLPIVAGAIAGALVPAMIALASSIWGVIAPLLPFMAAGAALAALGYAMYLAWENAPVVFWMLAGAIAAVAGGIMILLMPALIAQAAAWWATAAAVWAAYAPVLGTIALFAAVGVAIGLVTYAIYSLYVAWQTNMYGIQEIASTVWAFITTTIGESMGIISSVVFESLQAVLGFFVDILGVMFQTVVDVFSGIGSFIVGTIGFLLALFTGAGKEKMNLAFAVMMGGVQNIAIGIMNGVIGVIEKGLNRVIDLAKELAKKLSILPGFGAINAVIQAIPALSLPRIASVDTSVPGGLAAFVGEDLKATMAKAMGEASAAFAGIGGVTTDSGGGGGGGGGKDTAATAEKKAAEALKKEIEGNINDLAKRRSDTQSNRDQVTREIEKIDDELAREKREGVKQNAALVAKRAELAKQQTADTAELAKLDKQLSRAEGDLASAKRKEIAAKEAEAAQQKEFRETDDIIAEQKRAEAAAEEAKRKADAERKKNGTATSTASGPSTVATPPSTPSAPSAPSVPSNILGGGLAAQGIVLLDVNGSGDKTYYFDIHDNEFYGDDEDFAMRIGKTLMGLINQNTAVPTT